MPPDENWDYARVVYAYWRNDELIIVHPGLSPAEMMQQRTGYWFCLDKDRYLDPVLAEMDLSLVPDYVENQPRLL